MNSVVFLSASLGSCGNFRRRQRNGPQLSDSDHHNQMRCVQAGLCLSLVAAYGGGEQGKTDCAHASDHRHVLAVPLTPESESDSESAPRAHAQSHVSVLSLPLPLHEHTALYYGSSLLLSFAKTMKKKKTPFMKLKRL